MATQVSIGAISLSDGAETLGKQSQYLTIDAARNSVREQFANYHQLLNKKELELISELDQLETANEPELTHVKHDLKRLRGVVDSLNDSLGTNTLKIFLEKQKSIWDKEIKNFERSEELLSHVTLNYSDFNRFVNQIIEIVPFRTKAKFRTDLEPLLKLEPKLGEEWFVVSEKWFSSFAASINFYDPQPNDSWEFPKRIPIDNSCLEQVDSFTISESSPYIMHSRAWDLLLGFNCLGNGSLPINRKTYLDTLHQIQIPLKLTNHKCYIGYNDGNSKLNIEYNLRTLPYETYGEILKRLSPRFKLFTNSVPQLYCFDASYTVTFNVPIATDYTVTYPYYNQRLNTSIASPVLDLTPQVGPISKLFIIVIPDFIGTISIKVSSNR